MPTANTPKERRIYSQRSEVRLEKEDEFDVLVGYASVFGETIDLGYFTEEVGPGAFTSSLERKDDVRALFNHNRDLILARTPNTLELSQDEKGLKCRIKLPKTTYCQDLLKHIELGNISQMSFGFYILKEEYIAATKENGREKGHFIIRDVELFDVSPVTFPAYPSTSIEVERFLSEKKDEFEERLSACGIAEPSQAELSLRFREQKLRLLKLASQI